MYSNANRKNKGFTLVEIAIVVVLVGLALGAVVKGTDMLQSVRKQALQTEIKTTKNAFDAFKKKYNALPGDMLIATTRLQNCSGACINGNGDTFIGTPNAPITSSYALGGTDGEYQQFWQHLNKAGLRENPNPPAPKAGGSLMVRSINQDLCYAAGQPAKLQGIWLVWQNQPYVAADTSPVISPRDAMIMDRKYDDGKPAWGNIRAAGAANFLANNDGCKTDPNTYVSSDNKTCYMMFRLSDSPTL
jgi:prepilin-type N-terminal cleavage/methylation domain-containing protein